MLGFILLVACGFVLGALTMIALGWEPLLRGAVRFVPSARRTCQRLESTDAWQRLCVLSRSLASHPVKATDMLALSSLEASTAAQAIAKTAALGVIPELPWAAQVFALCTTTEDLVHQSLGARAQLAAVDRALASAEAAPAFRASLLSMTPSTSRLFQMVLRTLRALVEQAGASVRVEDNAATQAMAAQLMSALFGPPLALAPDALFRLLTNHDALLHQANTLGEANDTLQAHVQGPSLLLASAAAATAPVDVAWANALAARWFSEYASIDQLVAVWEASANRALRKLPLPATIDALELRNLKPGPMPPVFSDVVLLQTHKPGEICMAATIDYSGGLAFELHTSVPLSDLSRATVLSFRVFIDVFHCRLRVFVPAPREDVGHGWVAFEAPPDVALRIESCHAPPQQLPQLAKLVTREVSDAIASDAVLPLWTRVELPWHPLTASLAAFLDGAQTRDVPATEPIKSFVETAGGMMGSAVGGAFGGAFGGKVARAVGEKMGEHLAKMASSTLSPVVHDVVATAKSFASPKHKKAEPVDTTAPLAAEKTISVDALVALARQRSAAAIETSEKMLAPRPVATPKKTIDVAQLVSLAKQTKNHTD
ncbi:hypothetical protein ACHHYP_13927 [Achlya hypogyna]|uniref:SMP-LTD domain-containing protein n=1 Tax=Achlya hypogyna TaxID=1202772 RepID=A0A1V9YED8_ACHHY|nr:hypothetical protein ACHHYP_13927 [Achlya hypogyna]